MLVFYTNAAIVLQNLATGVKNFSETSKKHFTSHLSKSLGLHEQGCVILHVLPVSMEPKNLVFMIIYVQQDQIRMTWVIGSWKRVVFSFDS